MLGVSSWKEEYKSAILIEVSLSLISCEDVEVKWLLLLEITRQPVY